MYPSADAVSLQILISEEDDSSHDFHSIGLEHESVYALQPSLWITGSHCFMNAFIGRIF